MGKRSGKYRKNDKGASGSKKVKSEWKCQKIPDDHPLFRQYYQRQLGLNEEDFAAFWVSMKEKLPVVFRVNPNCANHEAFCAKIEDENFINSIMSLQVKEEAMKEEGKDAKEDKADLYQPKQLPKLELIKWYPGNIVYTLNTSKQTFKKSKLMAQFHKYLQKSFDSGLISRQELVSMLPPLYLNVKSDDIVLDLCAAPGSKTSQILQMIYGDRRWLANGCVIANDADYSRAQMLIHQLQRSGTTGMAVVNHPGQFLPELYTTKVGSVRQKFQFDKILCDVPCSGDGATRKLPIKWAKWHTSDGMVLHPLQLSILMKAINLLKKDGYIVYSTCSLNPIENEAVVNALFQKVGKGLELIDIHPMYAVKGRRGLSSWKVYSIADRFPDKKEEEEPMNQEKQDQKQFTRKYLKQYKNFQQVKAANHHKIKETMFPPSEEEAKQRHLDYTMRVLPHDQNSGGFYVALFKKCLDFEWKYTAAQKKNIEEKGEAEVEAEFLEKNLPEVEENVPQEDGQEEKVENNAQDEQDEGQDNEQEDQGEEKIEQKIQQQDNQQQAKQMQKAQKQFRKYASQLKQQANKNKKDKNKSSKYECYKHMQAQEFENIQKFYGLPDNFRDLLFVRSSEGENASRKVLLVSEGVRKFLNYDSSKKIKLVNMGCQVFQKGKQSFAGSECLYRLCQDGIHFLLEHLKLRKVKVDLNFFKKAISIKSLAHELIQSQEIRQRVQEMTQGSFCIYIDEEIEGRHVVDALVGQNFKNSFHLMVSKEDQASLAIRYL